MYCNGPSSVFFFDTRFLENSGNAKRKEFPIRGGSLFRISRAMRLSLVSLLVVASLYSVYCQDHNDGFDHRAHAVPGSNKVVYDLDGNLSEEILLDGSGSHSHYFKKGPPTVSGNIKGYEWVNDTNGAVVCTTKRCKLNFPVGETILSLLVWDNTGDSAKDKIKITVKPKIEASAAPVLWKVSPDEAPDYGMQTVTLKGNYFYHDSEVYFGDSKGRNVRHVDLKTILVSAPHGTGYKPVKVVSSIGNSNSKKFKYMKSTAVPIKFLKKHWKTETDSKFTANYITGITIGWDFRYYMSSRTGYVYVAKVSRNLRVLSSCRGAFMGRGRAVAGIGYNPFDLKKRFLVTTNTFYFKNVKHRKIRWDNGKVEAVYLDKKGCPVRGETIISGLPVSNHDHGANHFVFDNKGRILISVGSSTNAGHSAPGDGAGGVPESPLSAAVLEADYLKPNFKGEILYDKYDNPETANVISGDVVVFASGVRNSFGMVIHSNGQLYATDNGPNVGFGKTSVTCDKIAHDPHAPDKLLRVVRGLYYGHPNRNRGRKDAKQCRYRKPWEPTKNGYSEPLGLMKSSTNGIIDYRANYFDNALRGNLLMSKVAFKENGLLWRAELSKNGEFLKNGPYQFQPESGLSIVMGLWGEIFMPQIEKGSVLVYQPVEKESKDVKHINVFPTRGPKSGGNAIMVTGYHLSDKNIKVSVGGKPCTSIREQDFYSLKCTAPSGLGKVEIVVRRNNVTSEGHSDDYHYL